MSATLANGFPSVHYGASPKELHDIETRFSDFEEKLGHAYGTRVKPSPKYWADSDLDNFRGAKWSRPSETVLNNIADAWVQSLQDKEHLHRLPVMTAYLALQFPQVDDLSRTALELLGSDYTIGTEERPGFTNAHLTDVTSSRLRGVDDKFTFEYLRFRSWYDALSVRHRIAFSSFLALTCIQLCNQTAEDVLKFVNYSAMQTFQQYWRVPHGNLSWIPLNSLMYLQSYFQAGSQLLVTVMRPFLNLRKQLLASSAHPSLLDCLEAVLYSQTSGKGLELVHTFQEAVTQLCITKEQLLAEMELLDVPDTRKRLDIFLRSYDIEEDGLWLWAQLFTKDYFADFQATANAKALDHLSALKDSLDDQNEWVLSLRVKYGTKRERASSASYEGFWDGARRIDYC